MYQAPVAGKALTSVVVQGLRTPILRAKFCNNQKPFYYPNSPQIPRYSITCLVDPEADAEFIKTISSIEKRENSAQTVLKADITKNDGGFVNTGLCLLKFNDKKPIVVVQRIGEELSPYSSHEDLPMGSEVMIDFDIIRYTKKGSSEVGLSLRPSLITLIVKKTQPQSISHEEYNEEIF